MEVGARRNLFSVLETTDLSEVFTHLVLDEAEFCGLAIEVIDEQAGGGILFLRECLK
ncbi:MAG: hypothetical protein LR011_05445 [Verrucomicrobia bacterium]|nr:hypothetical protein [Verrucomicrobiota bacterium]